MPTSTRLNHAIHVLMNARSAAHLPSPWHQTLLCCTGSNGECAFRESLQGLYSGGDQTRYWPCGMRSRLHTAQQARCRKLGTRSSYASLFSVSTTTRSLPPRQACAIHATSGDKSR